ncbi:hypothetical protein K3495_g7330 [Podosphaera aphanis]|nr:hypothetical protein K3495_g7330 [Podosphaera aphanis]
MQMYFNLSQCRNQCSSHYLSLSLASALNATQNSINKISFTPRRVNLRKLYLRQQEEDNKASVAEECRPNVKRSDTLKDNEPTAKDRKYQSGQDNVRDMHDVKYSNAVSSLALCKDPAVEIHRVPCDELDHAGIHNSKAWCGMICRIERMMDGFRRMLLGQMNLSLCDDMYPFNARSQEFVTACA